ncbi:MAG TPA: hypothetical protein VNK41_03700 [Vicinamibacterales bacterium]|nr:hypothetical protein [Vicinamibacterales bacterium]
MAASIADALRTSRTVIAAELRPPRAELEASAGIEAWIDTYHAVRRLSAAGTYVFLTDSAVGTPEEDNLRHLVANLGTDVPRDRVVPFLTCKHPLAYCLSYAERARQHGFPALVVLGGDRSVGVPRCVGHAWELRKLLREREPSLVLGGWANPHADSATQAGYLVDGSFSAEFYLTQIVSHHDRDRVAGFIKACERTGVTAPGMFGVFFYRSANPKTLAALARFLPVPVDALRDEFAAGASPEEICARTLRTLLDVGARHFYISNLPLATASRTLGAILERVGVAA